MNHPNTVYKSNKTTKRRLKMNIAKILLPTILAILITSTMATIYWSTSITNTGTIIAYGCKVYLEDKATESYNINWGNLPVNTATTQYRWIYNNGTGTNIQWTHNAPSYLQLKTYYEQPTGTWNLWNTGTTISLTQSQWLHIKLELTTLPESINHLGSFQFSITIELT